MDSIFGSDVRSPPAEDGDNQQIEIQASSPFLIDTTEAPQTTYDGYQPFDPSLHWEPEAIGEDTQRKMTLSRC